MLVLNRKVDESIDIGSDITITVLRINSKQIRIGVEAPKEITVLRRELHSTEPKTSFNNAGVTKNGTE